MAVGSGLVGERRLETRFPVKAPLLLRITVHIPNGEDVQAVPTVDCGASWAPKRIALAVLGLDVAQVRVHTCVSAPCAASPKFAGIL